MSSLRTLAATALLASSLTVGAATVAAPAQAAGRACATNEPFITSLRATNIGCARALQVAKKWERKALYDEAYIRPYVQFDGWKCRHNGDTSKTRCVKGAKVVKFSWGY